MITPTAITPIEQIYLESIEELSRVKVCITCSRELPAITEFFYRSKLGKYGLRSRCKECIREIRRPQFDENVITSKNFKVCQICGAKFKQINHHHLRTHNLTLVEYQTLYPDEILISDATRKKHSEAGKNRQISDATRKKMSLSNSGEKNPMYGKTHTKKTRQKIREAKIGEKSPWFGKHFSNEHRKNLSEALTGRKFSPEHKQKISKALTGRIISEETKQKISKAHTGKKSYWFGRKHSDETKQKIGEALTGRIISEETRRKISVSQKEYHRKRKMLNISLTEKDKIDGLLLEELYTIQTLNMNLMANIYFFWEEESVWALYVNSPLEEESMSE